MRYFILSLVTLTLLVDATILTVFINKWFILSIAVPLVLINTLLKNIPKKKKVVGFELGKGTDITNPETPINVKQVVLEDKVLNLGFLGIGSPGSGKSVIAVSVLEYFTKVREGGWLYADGKGDLDIYQSCMSCGAQPDKFFSSELPSSETVNVVSGPLEDVIDSLIEVLITTDNEYYKNAQKAALRSVLPLLYKIGIPFTLRDLYVVFANNEAFQYVLNLANKHNVSPDVIELANNFFEIEPKSRAEQVNGLLTRMQLFVTGDVADRINAYEPTLNLEKAVSNNLKVYLHMPYTHFSKDIATLLTQQLGGIAKNRQLYEEQRTPWPMTFDDWGAFFFDGIGPITARCRSAKMPVSYLFQSKGQTNEISVHFTDQLTDNIGVLIVLRINGQGTASWAGGQFGTYESVEYSANENTHFNGTGQSMTVTEKPRIRADDIKNLNAGEAYIDTFITGDGGKSSNKRYKAQFPLPDFSKAREYQWPIIETGRHNDECEGLHLWRDFMNADRLKQLKSNIVKSALDDTKEGITELDEVDFL